MFIRKKKNQLKVLYDSYLIFESIKALCEEGFCY